MVKQEHFRWVKQVMMKALVVGLLLTQAVSAQSSPLKIGTCEESPTNFTQNEQVTGFVTEIVEAILALLSLKVDIRMYPWARI